MVVGGRRRANLVCEMLWPTSRLTGWVKRCEVDVYSKRTHTWTSSILLCLHLLPKVNSKSIFGIFRDISDPTYTHVLAVLDSELAQMLWHALETHTLSTHSWISSIFMMSTPFSKSKVYILFLAFFVAFSHSTYTCVLAVLDSELAQMLCHAFDTHTVCTDSWISSIFMMPTPLSKSKVYTLFLAFFVAFSHSTIQRTLVHLRIGRVRLRVRTNVLSRIRHIQYPLTVEYLVFLSCLHHLPKVKSIPYFWHFKSRLYKLVLVFHAYMFLTIK